MTRPMMLDSQKKQTLLRLGDVMVYDKATATVSFSRSKQEGGRRLYWQVDDSNGPRDRVSIYTEQDADTLACLLAGSLGFKFEVSSSETSVTYVFQGR